MRLAEQARSFCEERWRDGDPWDVDFTKEGIEHEVLVTLFSKPAAVPD